MPPGEPDEKLAQFTPDLKDQMLLALVIKAGGQARLRPSEFEGLGLGYTLLLKRTAPDEVTLRAVLRQ